MGDHRRGDRLIPPCKPRVQFIAWHQGFTPHHRAGGGCRCQGANPLAIAGVSGQHFVGPVNVPAESRALDAKPKAAPVLDRRVSRPDSVTQGFFILRGQMHSGQAARAQIFRQFPRIAPIRFHRIRGATRHEPRSNDLTGDPQTEQVAG